MVIRNLRHRLRWTLALLTLPVVLLAGNACSNGSGRPPVSVASTAIPLVHPGVLTVCTHPSQPPFVFLRGGKVVGFDADLVALIAKDLGVRLIFQAMPFELLTHGRVLDAGMCDLEAANITITVAREQVVDFTKPYFAAAQGLLVRSRDRHRYASLTALAGHRVGVQAGTTGQAYVNTMAPVSVQVVPFDNFDAATQALAAGNIDGTVNDAPICLDLAARNKRFTVSATFVTRERYGFALKKNGNPKLLRVANQVIERAMQDGTWTTLYREWLHVKQPPPPPIAP